MFFVPIHTQCILISSSFEFKFNCELQISLIKLILYIAFQCIGGIIGAAIMKALTCNWQIYYATTKLKVVNATCDLGKL